MDRELVRCHSYFRLAPSIDREGFQQAPRGTFLPFLIDKTANLGVTQWGSASDDQGISLSSRQPIGRIDASRFILLSTNSTGSLVALGE